MINRPSDEDAVELAKYREMFQHAEDAIGLVDPETGSIVEANPKFSEILGYDEVEEVEGKLIAQLSADIEEFSQDQAMQILERVRDGEPQSLDWLVKRKDGTPVWVAVSLSQAIIGDERRIIAFFRDVTERKEREERLVSYEAMVEAVGDVVYTLDEDYNFTMVTGSAVDLTGYTCEELEGQHLSMLISQQDLERGLKYRERVVEGDIETGTIEGEVHRKDGGVTPVEFRYRLLPSEDEFRGTAGVIRDITERRRQEAEIDARTIELAKYREIFQHAEEAIGLVDPETGTVVETNPKFREITGYEADELQGKLIAEISADTDEFSQDEAMQILQRVMDGESQSFDWLVKRKDSTTIWVAVSLTQAVVGDETRIMAFFRDVTDRRQREQELDRHQRQMEFFNSLLRHDILNATTVIRTHASMLARSLDGEERESAETIVEWSDNVTGVVDRVRKVLQTLTGEEDQVMHSVDLSEQLEAECIRIAGAYPDVTLETEIPENVPVQADDLLGDVFGNVLTNAIDHNERDDLSIAVTVDPGPEVVTVRIADNGSGVEDEKKDAIFRRGETGHVKKTGSGFGLFFVDSMVNAYDGDVWIEDNEPSGSVVVIELPAARE